MNRLAVCILSLLLFSCCHALASETDSIAVVIRNKMTGKAVDWKYTLSLYSDKDTIVTHSKFSKKKIMETWPSEFLTLRLNVHDHYFVWDFHSSGFEDFSIAALNYNLNFDEPLDKVCNRVYYTNNSGETMVKIYCGDNAACCDQDIEIPSQSLQVMNEIYIGFGSSIEDEVDYTDTYFGYHAQYNGTYKAQLSDNTAIMLVLGDSTNASIQLIQNEKTVSTWLIWWMFDDENKAIQLNAYPQIPADLVTKTGIDLSQHAFIFEKENPKVLGVYAYRVLNDKITKEKVLELVRA